jgi:hypothetical protein
MPRKARKPAAARSPGCNGFCMDLHCPSCWTWLAEATSVDKWFDVIDPKPTLLVLDLDEPTFAVLQREAADHKTSIETVATVLLREWAEGKGERVPRREAAPFAGANRGR